MISVFSLRTSVAIGVVAAMIVPLPAGADNTLPARPNILFVMSDDHAKQAISCYGDKDIRTPGLDRLAGERRVNRNAC